MIDRFSEMKAVMTLLCGTVCCAASPATRQGFSINFDQGQRTLSQGSNAIIDSNNNVIFSATIDKGTKASERPQIVSQGCHTQPGCLRVSLDPSENDAAKNKIMYSFWSHYKPLPDGERGRMLIGSIGSRRISFSMKLGHRYDTPLHQMIHFQIYQPEVERKQNFNQGVVPGGPILSLRIVPLSRRTKNPPNTQEFIIAARSPKFPALYYYDQRDGGVLYRGSIKKGQWNLFTFQINSVRNGRDMAGMIRFYLNNRKVFDTTTSWGFNPEDYTVSSKLGFELGSYRSADNSGHQVVFFDDISINGR